MPFHFRGPERHFRRQAYREPYTETPVEATARLNFIKAVQALPGGTSIAELARDFSGYIRGRARPPIGEKSLAGYFCMMNRHHQDEVDVIFRQLSKNNKSCTAENIRNTSDATIVTNTQSIGDARLPLLRELFPFQSR